MREEIERFVASLAIPADRKTVVLAELLDHVASAREAATRQGRDADAAGRAALGNLEALRRSLEAVEPAFRTSRAQALGRGVVASLLVAVALDQAGALLHGALGALVAIAIAAALAPPRALELLRAELRAPRIRGTVGVVRGLPIGPALVYAFTVMSGPFVLWIALIVARAYAGVLRLDVPDAAFGLLFAVYAVLLVEGVRARLRAAA
ncbi:MAG TPA: hypothetical protein VF334_15135 [Polyangia bacterium]